jgi:hypothetical protein
MRAQAPAAALLVTLAAFGIGCGGADEATGDPSLAVYVSAPLSGPDAVEGLAVADGARDALADAGSEAAGVEVEAVVLDSGPGASASEPTEEEADPVRAAVNARMATQDSTAIAYIGELDPATTRTSLPITNDARILQVSPTAGAVDLVAPFDGSDEVPPETQPSGARTFGTLAELEGEPRELGAEAMALVLDSIDRSDDPLDRASVVEAFLATGERESALGPYSIDELGRADPTTGAAS